MTFIKYQHLERFGTQETEGILDGLVYVFPKIDGTNASVWFCTDKNRLRFGSRNRELDLENDNAGFMNAHYNNDSLLRFFYSYNVRLFGEWLVPHSLKTYQDDAWRKFYVFDVVDEEGNYIPYDIYKPWLDEFGIEYIPPICMIKNPQEEHLFKALDKCGQFLIKNDAGLGEGIVLKNYDYSNKYGRQTWAKIITNEFKTIHHREMGAPLVSGSKIVEEEIVEFFVTEDFVKKEQAKIVLENNGEWENKLIPKVLGIVFYELIREEMWNILKKHKNPKINFSLLQKMTQTKVKKVLGL